MAPLQFWRGERVIYGRSDTRETVLVASIKEVIRYPPEAIEPLGKRKRTRASQSQTRRSQSRGADGDGDGDGDDDDGVKHVLVWNPEEGWDDETPETVEVVDFDTGDASERRTSPSLPFPPFPYPFF